MSELDYEFDDLEDFEDSDPPLVDFEILEEEDEVEGDVGRADPKQTILTESNVTSIRPVLKENRKARPFHAADILERMRCNPIEILAHIAMGNNHALGVEEEVRVIERRLAASELASYTTAKIKPKDLIEDDVEVKSIPIFIPKRGVILEDFDRVSYDAYDEQNGSDAESGIEQAKLPARRL